MDGGGKPAFLGDVSPEDAYDILSNDPNSALVDVRTLAELAFVGAPDLQGLGKTLHHVEWSAFPGGQLNANFVEEIAPIATADGCEQLLFLCRSGFRSLHAAQAVAAGPFAKPLKLYNIASGFEGGLDAEGHRGGVSGWKFAGLPWRQT